MRIVTERLILRPPTLKDAADIVENVNNLSVSRYLAVVPYPYSMEDARFFIKLSKKNPHNFGISLKSSGKIIGMIGLMNLNEFIRRADIGYWLGKKYWRQGFATEALQAIVKYSFRKLKLVRLQAGVAVENKASAKLLKKVGFKKEGLRRKAMRAKSTGKWHDTYAFGLLRSDVEL
jgi:RimJ/RimL family protein N-acetyltransferase